MSPENCKLSLQGPPAFGSTCLTKSLPSRKSSWESSLAAAARSACRASSVRVAAPLLHSYTLTLLHSYTRGRCVAGPHRVGAVGSLNMADSREIGAQRALELGIIDGVAPDRASPVLSPVLSPVRCPRPALGCSRQLWRRPCVSPPAACPCASPARCWCPTGALPCFVPPLPFQSLSIVS